MIGVSNYTNKVQFISLDGTRSAFDSSSLTDPEWIEQIIPQGKQIRTVETLVTKTKNVLCGFKWLGDDGAVLVAVGEIDDPEERNNPKLELTTLTLNQNQRLVGMKSWAHGFKYAFHAAF